MSPDNTLPSGSDDQDRSLANISDPNLASTVQSFFGSRDIVARVKSRIGNKIHPPPRQNFITQSPIQKPRSDLIPQTAVSAPINSLPPSSPGVTTPVSVATGSSVTPTISGIPSFTTRGYPLSGHGNLKFWVGLEVKCDSFTKEDYAKKAKYIQGKLQGAVDEQELSSRADSITYGSYMVGHAADTVQPAIVVCSAPKTLRKSLKDLFHNDFLKRLNCKNYPQISNPVTPKGARRDRPFFWLCHAKDLNIIRNTGVMVTNSTAGELASTWCGAWVEHGTRRATVGLTLELNGITQLLTVEHLFQNITAQENRARMIEASVGSQSSHFGVEVQHSDKNQVNIDGDEGEGNNSQDESVGFEEEEDDDDDSDTWSCFSESEEDHSEVSETNESEKVIETVSGLEERINAFQHGQLGYRSEELVTEYSSRGKVLKWESGCRTPALATLPPSSPFLDWAVFSLHEFALLPRRQNEIFIDDVKVVLKEIADSPRIHTTPVIMISGVHGQRNGTLIDGVYYLGSTPGQDMCKVWVVVMDSEKVIEPGECGSIIVDRETFDVYGHVVGSNILGHAYVVPLRATIEQIKKVFQVQRVVCPIATPRDLWWSTPSASKLVDIAREHFLGNSKSRDAYNNLWSCDGEDGFLTQTADEDLHSFSEAVVLEVYRWLLADEVWPATGERATLTGRNPSTPSSYSSALQLINERFGIGNSSPGVFSPYASQLQIVDAMEDTHPGRTP